MRKLIPAVSVLSASLLLGAVAVAQDHDHDSDKTQITALMQPDAVSEWAIVLPAIAPFPLTLGWMTKLTGCVSFGNRCVGSDRPRIPHEIQS